MSAKNGNRSRFHRERKQKIARRQRTQEMIKAASQAKQDATAATSKPRSVSA